MFSFQHCNANRMEKYSLIKIMVNLEKMLEINSYISPNLCIHTIHSISLPLCLAISELLFLPLPVSSFAGSQTAVTLTLS